MKCFYHSADLDGHCAGAVVKYFYPECETIGIDYGDEFPWHSIKQDEIVYMVDFSLQPFDGMIKLTESTPFFHWIDHHISAIKDHQKSQKPITGKRREGIGACQLVWEYLDPTKPLPEAIKLIAEYDVWNHIDPKTLPFQYGMRLMKTWPDDPDSIWNELFNPLYTDQLVSNIVAKGATVIEYIRQDNEKYCKSCAFDTELDGLKCVAINKMLTNSQVFDSVWDNTKYDAMLTFGRRKGKWTVSLYTDNGEVDVSVIAKNRCGGGHKQAAGFQCDKLPFKI